MTTSQSTTFSPSRRSTTRSTPCVLGCCGPMLMTSSSVSNIAPRTVCCSMAGTLLTFRLFLRLTEPQPVERVFHQQLAGPLERIVLALRETLPVLRHEDAPTIGVTGEVDAEHVPYFTLEPVGRGPHAGHRRQAVVLAHLHLQTHTVTLPGRVQTVDDVEAAHRAR